MTIAVFRIDGLALYAHHGVLDAERILGQRFFLDLLLSVDVGDAPHSDQIGDSVHYGDVVEAAMLIFTTRRFNLIETAANAVAEGLLERFPKIVAVAVTVHKPSAPVAAIVADISVTVERRND